MKKDHPRTNKTGNAVCGRDPRRKRRGTVLVEFALSFTAFLLITMVGIMDFGRAFWAYNVLAHASHEAARYAIVHGEDSFSPATETDILNVVRAQAPFLGSGVTVAVTWESAAMSPGTAVRIQADYTFVPVIISLLVPSIDLSSTAQMVITN